METTRDISAEELAALRDPGARHGAFDRLVGAYLRPLYWHARRLVVVHEDAEDVVQDVYEKLLHYNGTFESEEHLKAWLLRVAINRCRDITRAARQKDTELDENIPAPESGNDGSVLDAVRTLPENYRNAVYLHYYEGYTAAEVGRMLGAPTNTVLSWLRRARAQLHTLLKEEIEDEVV